MQIYEASNLAACPLKHFQNPSLALSVNIKFICQSIHYRNNKGVHLRPAHFSIHGRVNPCNSSATPGQTLANHKKTSGSPATTSIWTLPSICQLRYMKGPTQDHDIPREEIHSFGNRQTPPLKDQNKRKSLEICDFVFLYGKDNIHFSFPCRRQARCCSE